MWEHYLILIAGLATLAVSGNFLVDGSVAMSKHLKVSTLVIGVVVVSFGTSAPELIVSLQAAIDNHPDISVGNVVGSNISNIALILAITAIIMPIPVRSKSIKTDWPVMMGASILPFLFMLSGLIIPGEGIKINRTEGIIFVSLLLIYIIWSIRSSRKSSIKEEDTTNIKKPKYSLPISVMIVAASCTGLVFGAKWLVNSAAEIARSFDVSERVISITLIAFGTSVPELAASIIAVIKKEMDISIGNIIGSNLFNILGILGITSIIKPISNINAQLNNFDIFWMLGISALLFALIIPLSGGILKRWKGMILLLIYIIYVYLLFNMEKSV